MLTRCGDDSFSLTVASPRDAQSLASALRPRSDWLEVVPGIDSVFLRFDATRHTGDEVRRLIEMAIEQSIEPLPTADDLIEIPVVYGGAFGPDIDELAEKTGLSVDDIIGLHTGSEFSVDMVGFTPGFAFIGGLDERLSVPRRGEPRQRVEAGSIGIADGRTGIYAMASPGGWALIGRTPARLFDPGAEQPFVLEPGMRIRFRSIGPDEFDR